MRESISDLVLFAAQEARALGHSYVGTVHLVIALSRGSGFGGLLLTPILASAAKSIFVKDPQM